MKNFRPFLATVAFTGFFVSLIEPVVAQITPPTPRPPDEMSQTLRPEMHLITTTTLVEPALIPTNGIELFNGKDFTGFTFVSRSSTHTPGETWSVTNGVIHCSGKSVGYLRTEKSFHDFKLTVEWCFVKMAPQADNTGVLVHMQLPDQVWPACVQVQGKHDRQGDLFLMAGAESKEHRGRDANTAIPMRGDSTEKPVGEWNTCEVVCATNSVRTFINGTFLNETTQCTVSSGFIGIQSEGAEFEIRKMFLEPVK